MSNEKSVAQLLAEGTNPTKAAAPAAAPSALESLVAIMLRKEAHEAADQATKAEQAKARQAHRNRNANEQSAKALLKQAKCKHLKGGKNRQKGDMKIDYALAKHVFVNNIAKISCLICKMKWFQQDTIEYLFRNGKKISNHTKLGWKEVSDLFENSSTNKFSSSEISIGVANGTQAAATPEFNSRLRDLDGNVVTDVEL
jgi:hypothetical protein